MTPAAKEGLPAVVGELVALVERYSGDGELQSFESRERFRKEARATLSALTAEAGKGEVTDAMVDSVRADIMQSAAADGHTHVVIKDEWVRDALEAALSTATPAGEWREIESAPKDGSPVLLLTHTELPERAEGLQGICFVGRHVGDAAQWCFAAPVGFGGIPDAWLAGWKPLPPLAASPRGASAGEG